MNNKALDILENLYNLIDSPVIVMNQEQDIVFCNFSAKDLLLVPENKPSLLKDIFTIDNSQDLKKAIEKSSEKVGLVMHYGPLKTKNEKKYDLNIARSDIEGQSFTVITIRESSDTKLKDIFDYSSMSAMENISSLEEIGQLAATVAHEVNTPLSVVLIALKQIENDSNKNSSTIKSVDLIRRASHKIARIVSRLNRVSASREAEFHLACPLEITQEAIQICERSLKEQNIHINLTYDDFDSIHCNPIQVEQILINLLNNASYALKNEVRGKEIKIRLFKDHNGNHIEVWNNGSTIPKEVQNKILIPLFNNGTLKEQGNGLGLPISYKIMKQHKGDITFKSNRDDGTYFRLTFPQQLSNVKVS